VESVPGSRRRVSNGAIAKRTVCEATVGVLFSPVGDSTPSVDCLFVNSLDLGGLAIAQSLVAHENLVSDYPSKVLCGHGLVAVASDVRCSKFLRQHTFNGLLTCCCVFLELNAVPEHRRQAENGHISSSDAHTDRGHQTPVRTMSSQESVTRILNLRMTSSELSIEGV
jgi:hypothetical protein